MIYLELQVDADHAAAAMRAIWQDQLPFATSSAINRTALDFQKAQRAHQASIFRIRRPAFVQNAVKIKPFSSKKSLAARVMIDPPGGQARADILTKFETDTQKFPFRGTRLAVPTDNVPRTGAGIVKKGWRPKDLGLSAHGSGSRALPGKGHMVLKGKRRTVAFLRPGGRGGIFERDGDELVPLYWFVPSVPIKPTLHFESNTKRTVERQWASNFTTAFDRAINTARAPQVGFARAAATLARVGA
ncbi:MAG: hypothetical protein AB7I13_00250 [Vicinamibacterales bacterium]